MQTAHTAMAWTSIIPRRRYLHHIHRPVHGTLLMLIAVVLQDPSKKPLSATPKPASGKRLEEDKKAQSKAKTPSEVQSSAKKIVLSPTRMEMTNDADDDSSDMVLTQVQVPK